MEKFFTIVHIYRNEIKISVDGHSYTRSGGFANYESNDGSYRFFIEDDVVFESPTWCTLIINED